MKIAVAYPPIESSKGTPLLGQNRQFQYFNAPTYIYPMVPAYTATLLASKGHEVAWLDGISERWTYGQFCLKLANAHVDLLIMETKTPVIKAHWRLIGDLKNRFPDLKIAIVGDHVTFLPEETLTNCPVDYVITGGDYDFLAANLAEHVDSNGQTALEPGIWWRESGQLHNSGAMSLKTHRLDDLPLVDRDLTRWPLYAYHNGNYKYLPGTYMYSGRDCWWGRCTFCVWDHTLYPVGNFRVHSVERQLQEVGLLVNRYHVREIFDDCGTFPTGKWLRKFCEGMIAQGYNKRVKFGCNMRVDALEQDDYDLMGRAGFRFILYGMESGNQKTLDMLDKGTPVETIERGLCMAKKAGLEPHITVMMGYPWENGEDSQRTVDLCKRLFRKGYVDTLQGTIVVPYPGTPLFKLCQEKGWLKTTDWDRYDMRESVMVNPISDEQVRGYTQELYKSFLSPQYLIRKMVRVRSVEDIKFFVSAGQKLWGHLLDFARRQPAVAQAQVEG